MFIFLYAYILESLVLNHNALADYRAAPDKIKEQVQSIVNRVNESLPRNVTLKKFSILDKPFTEASGEKLTNGEINRLKIQGVNRFEKSSYFAILLIFFRVGENALF